MIPSFSLNPIPRIEFGSGYITTLPTHIADKGSNLLLITGGHFFSQGMTGQNLLVSLERSDIHVQIEEVRQEPSPEIVNTIINRYSDKNIDIVTAIGGGSVLDTGKAVAAMLVEKGDVTRFLEGIGTTQPGGQRLPFIAVPTTSGTGSEATANAVLSAVGKEGFKKSLRHPNYVPDLALIDPHLIVSCPPRLSAFAAMDCFTQLVESYLSINASRFTDILALEGIRDVARSIRTVFHDGSDISARSDIAHAALLSGITLANAGLGTIHGFASAVGGLFPVPHGLICGSLMPAANKLTLQRLREIPASDIKHNTLLKYATLGRIFSGAENCENDEWLQDFFIEELYRLREEFHLPSFTDYGLRKEDIPIIVKKTGNKYNPVHLDRNDLSTILNNSF